MQACLTYNNPTMTQPRIPWAQKAPSPRDVRQESKGPICAGSDPTFTAALLAPKKRGSTDGLLSSIICTVPKEMR